MALRFLFHPPPRICTRKPPSMSLSSSRILRKSASWYLTHPAPSCSGPPVPFALWPIFPVSDDSEDFVALGLAPSGRSRLSSDVVRPSMG